MKKLVFGVTKTCQMTHLTKMTMEETSRRDGVGMLLTKFHIYSLFTTSYSAKYIQNYIISVWCYKNLSDDSLD